MKPVVDGLKKEYEGKVEFKLYNVEKDAEGAALANKLGAQFVPTFEFVNADGSINKEIVGEVSEAQLRQQLDALK
ncbi:MAG: thioredoxin [Actinobacteria bacterium]|nr:MAG: thioredoxin [Actinomycetota bacterium]